MIKRFTKVTSLLVVAASVMSTVPVMAADYKVVEAEEGTISKAVAKGNGKFIVDGWVNGEDGAVYYVEDGKFNKIKVIDAGDTIGDIKFDRYLEVNNGDYYVDLTTGEKTEDDIEGNFEDDVARTLRSKIKKDNDGRFSQENFTVDGKYNTNKVDKYMRPDSVFMYGITGKWCQFLYKLETKNLDGNQYSSIITDTDGNYIDADYNLGNIRVCTTSASVTIKNTNDTYKVTENGKAYELKAQIKKYEPYYVFGAYAEAWDSIYRQASLTIWRKEKGRPDSEYQDVTSEVEFGNFKDKKSVPITTNPYTSEKSIIVIQKMSKAQSSDDIDGIKYPKDVKTYFITDADGNDQPLLGGWNPKSVGINAEDVDYNNDVSMIGGSVSGDLMSGFYDKSEEKVYAETLYLKSKNGFNYTDIDDQYDTDCEAWAIGSGEFYCFSDGYIKKWNYKDGYDKLYKVDRTINHLSITDPLNIICWNEDTECYSIIAHDYTKDAATTPATTTPATATPVATAGWVKAIEGTWFYNKVDGTKATGWLLDGSNWYYLKADGVMATGWVNDNGIWYYLNTSGAMLANTTIDGYILGANGAWVQ